MLWTAPASRRKFGFGLMAPSRVARPDTDRYPLFGTRGVEMRTVIAQIDKALDGRLYYLALFAALTIPDLAASLESQDGRASGK
jgi:hypothetical protein